MTEPLSPAAQAVLEASAEHWAGTRTQAIAAALRAAADQVVPEEKTPWGTTLVAMVDSSEVRRQLLAIAAELEGTK